MCFQLCMLIACLFKNNLSFFLWVIYQLISAAKYQRPEMHATIHPASKPLLLWYYKLYTIKHKSIEINLQQQQQSRICSLNILQWSMPSASYQLQSIYRKHAIILLPHCLVESLGRCITDSRIKATVHTPLFSLSFVKTFELLHHDFAFYGERKYNSSRFKHIVYCINYRQSWSYSFKY